MQNSKPKMTDPADFEFYCTSKFLAERLACFGYTGRPTTNIYRADRPAWVFLLDPRSAEIIRDFFVKRDKGVPIVVKRYFDFLADQEGEKGQNNGI